MSKKQVLNEIIDLYDENEMLKGKIKEFLTIKTGICIDETEKDKAIKNLEFEAKTLLFERCFYEWHLPSVIVQSDSGELNFLTFEQWVKSINFSIELTNDYRYILDDLTQKELREYFRPQFENYFNNCINEEKMKLVREKKDE